MLESKNPKIAGGYKDSMQQTGPSPFIPKNESQQRTTFSLLNKFKFMWMYSPQYFDMCYSKKAL